MPAQSCDLIRASDWHTVRCTGETGPIHVYPDPFSPHALKGAGHETKHSHGRCQAAAWISSLGEYSDVAY